MVINDSLADYAATAATRLQLAGLTRTEATQSAEALARSVLGWDGATWLGRRRDSAPADFPSQFLPLIDRRARREPVAYIVGEREFYGRPFRVTRDVLIPRPETELVVEEALQRNRNRRRESISTVDIGTGSGCLAITLALELPSARVVATDISYAALLVARENARLLGATDRVEFRHGPFLAGAATPVGLIVANPPYVRDTDRTTLPAEVIDYEPHEALFAGPEGLDVIRALVALAAQVLEPDGWLILEIGQSQARQVQSLIEATPGLTFVAARDDLQGIPRVVVAERS